VPAAFLAAVQAAQEHSTLCTRWLQAVPLPARVQGFFKPTAAAILQRLRAQACLRTASGGLAAPAQVLRAPAALQALLPEPALLAGSGHMYLSPDLEASEVGWLAVLCCKCLPQPARAASAYSSLPVLLCL
jgi:hypothetical protein